MRLHIAPSAPAAPTRLRFGPCALDLGRRVLVGADGSETLLRPKAHELLRLLVARPGEVVTRREILDAVWPGLFVSDDSITQCVSEIRRALGPGAAALLRTVSRHGYVLDAEARSETPPPPHARPSLVETRPSIAVLPFRGWSVGGSEAWFEDGIAEGIVHVLSGLPGLFVASRGAALALSARLADPREVGRELGVRYVLSGGVRRSASRIRILSQPEETETGAVLRSEHHEGEADDLFALQDRISAEVVSAIAAPLRENELARARRKPPASLTAYDLLLRGLDALRTQEAAGFERGVGLLQQAIAADPGYAAPRSYLGIAGILRVSEGRSRDPAADIRAAGALADAAIRLDPQDALAMTARAYVRGYGERDYETARHLLDRAVATSPSCALAWIIGAALRNWTDDGLAAVAWAEHAVRLARLDPFAWIYEHVLGQAYFTAGRLPEAIAWSHRSLAGNPSTITLRSLIVSLAMAGRHQEVPQAVAQHQALDPGFRLAQFAARTPLVPALRDRFVALLREAGLPD